MKILGIRYDNITFDEAVQKLLYLLKSNNKATSLFLNADGVYKAQRDPEYSRIINSIELVLSDGIGLRLITRIFGENMRENCNGTDLSPILMKCAAKQGFKIFFLGGKTGIAEKAAENMRVQIPNIQIVGTHNGYFKSDEEVIARINESGADILFVAMGVPIQEKWIARNRQKLNPRLCLGVGALLDYLSGSIPRAPKMMRILHLEWLWRIFIEPKRMFKRYIIDGAKLFGLVLKYKLRPGRV